MKLSPTASVFLALSFLPSSTLAAQSERSILTKLFEDAGGPDWKNSQGWTNENKPVCSWFGVKCEHGTPGDDSGVTDIDLSYNDLEGKLPKHLWHMPDLRNLNLKGNAIYDAGFKGLSTGNVVSPINTLILTENSLKSVKGIGKMKQTLRYLHITSNRIVGPAFEELFELTHLQDLYTSFNMIDGSLPTTIGNMRNLKKFYCYGNQIEGNLPTELGNLDTLQIVTFAENKLDGTIPTEVNNMADLQIFSIHNHDDDTGTLTGPLPAFDRSPHLYELFLGGNALTGTIPHNLMEMSFSPDSEEDTVIGLANNEFTGGVPSELARFKRLTLNIVGNQIDYVPLELCAIEGWMGGEVVKYGCDAIMCPAGQMAKEGRSTDEDKCVPCPNGKNDSPFLGAMDCIPGQPAEGVDETGGTYQDNPTGEAKTGESADPLQAPEEESEGESGGKGRKVALGVIFGLGGIIALAFVALKVKSRRENGRDNTFQADDSIVQDMRDVM